MFRTFVRYLCVPMLATSALVAISTPAHASPNPAPGLTAAPLPVPTVQVDSHGARFELLGGGRWKLTIPGNANSSGMVSPTWITPSDCYGTFYGVSHREGPDGVNWGAEQTCDYPGHLPQHIDLYLQAKCTAWTCWYADEDYQRSPYSEDYTRVTHAIKFTPCLDLESRYFRLKVYASVAGTSYGPYYSGTYGFYYCGV